MDYSRTLCRIKSSEKLKNRIAFFKKLDSGVIVSLQELLLLSTLILVSLKLIYIQMAREDDLVSWIATKLSNTNIFRVLKLRLRPIFSENHSYFIPVVFSTINTSSKVFYTAESKNDIHLVL